MTKDEFISKYWNHYLILEEDFIKTSRYVDLDKENFKVYSVEFLKQLQAICSEVEALFKEISGITAIKGVPTISDYAKFILSKDSWMSDIVEKNINIKRKDIRLTPFKNWDENRASKSLSWWEDYNSVKHNRIINNKKANLENVLNSLSALYLLEKYLLKKVCEEENNDNDIPDRESNLFIIENWKTKSINLDNLIFKGIE